MRSKYHSLIPLGVTILILAIWTGCVEPISPDGPVDPDTVQLSLQVSVPGAGLETKAKVEADEAEKALHSLQVWAYVHGGAAEDAPVAYASQTSAGTVSLSFSKATVGLLDDDPVAIDLYVLGNAASAGKQDLGQNSTRDEVRESVISGNAVTGFGKACVETVSNDGLPMAGLLENFDITFLRYGYKNGQLTAKENDSKYDEEAFNTVLGEISSLSDLQKNYLKTLFRNGDEDAANYPYKWDYAKFSPTVSITRAVSKIRFVFAKGAEVSENVEISRIEFIGGTTTGGESIGLIPEQSYLFPLSEVKPLAAGYESIFWPKSETEALVADVPSVNALPQTYDASLDTNAAVKTIYLRESDLPLKGRIRYKRGSTSLMSSFDLVALTETFPRNATFTVYAYYTGGEMAIQLTVEVDPWDKNNYSVNFEDASIFAEKKFSIDHSTAQEVVPIRVDPNDPSSKIVRYDVYLKPNSPVKGSLTILTPKMGTLIIIKKEDPIGSFVVSPQTAQINVNDGGTIEISIDRSNTGESGASMFLSFGVEWPGREANADTELIDNVYRFVL